MIQHIQGKSGFWPVERGRKQPVTKKLLMLWASTLTSAECDTNIEHPIHMNQSHPSISKEVSIIRTGRTRG
jgi:hypothetical protein